ncbi:hypothetical protein RchiOBHm_Chr4g0432891 [Rosa chinensis]|uniref:Uncharacterized protein n=1 Tax=Rosa chinensis TaxID=74649 RepID=A0A2P6R159_ROSCH|nr:hypothetical protein RchiOBHm_Chr4g0432891 [Rosa chinensis]
MSLELHSTCLSTLSISDSGNFSFFLKCNGVNLLAQYPEQDVLSFWLFCCYFLLLITSSKYIAEKLGPCVQ